jgi:uncharacterized membrane protein
MDKKTFDMINALVASSLAAVVAISVIRQNFVVPAIAALVALVIMFAVRRRVSEVMKDERDVGIAGDAARLTITIVVAGSAILAFVFMVLRAGNPMFEILGQTLAYSACFTMILQSALFAWLSKK